MFYSLGHLEIEEIYVFVDITLSSFNFDNVSGRLSGGHWEQTQWVLHVRQQSI